MQKLVAEAITTGADSVDAQVLNKQVQLYRSAAQIGITQTAARSGKEMRKHNALARRLLNRQDDYIRFTNDWRIHADNNGSERDIRIIKLRQKVSRLPTHPHRSHTVLRDPQPPLHRRETRPTLLRAPRPTRRRPALATHDSLMTTRQPD
jgi:hypothetical protein